MHNAIRETMAIILAGGSGSRLKSLTRWHSKPAVPFGGKYKTIDFALSNCINSNIRKISILTQYKSHSLNVHIHNGWHFLRPELGEFIDLIPAQQRLTNSWYQGTADAVYQNIDIIQEQNPRYILVLAGDHIYKMDYRNMIQHHIDSGSDMTVGCIEVPLSEASEFGVMAIDSHSYITEFQEKPAEPKSIPGKKGMALASMGIYVFNADYLYQALEADHRVADSSHDFGKNIIPSAIHTHRISAFPFRNENGDPGYWRDVGTIDSFYETNISLCDVTPELNLYDTTWPIWTYQEQLPPAKFVFDDDDRRGYATDSLISAGCIISGGKIERSVLFNNVRVNSFSHIENSVILTGADIGRHCKIRNAVIDRNCVISPYTVIGYDKKMDQCVFYVSPKGITLVSPSMLTDSMPAQKELTLNHVA